jgi:hypothetical protein
VGVDLGFCPAVKSIKGDSRHYIIAWLASRDPCARQVAGRVAAAQAQSAFRSGVACRRSRIHSQTGGAGFYVIARHVTNQAVLRGMAMFGVLVFALARVGQISLVISFMMPDSMLLRLR